MGKKNKKPAQQTDALAEQMAQMHREGYRVLPAEVFASQLYKGNAEISSELSDVMNFAHLGVRSSAAIGYGTDRDNFGRVGGIAPVCQGGFASVGAERTDGVEEIGTKGRGYISWGNGNNLPNIIALAAGLQVYTATGLKFNTDVAHGLGLEPMYKTYSGSGITRREELIPYAAAGDMLRERILTLRTKIFTLTRDYINQPPRPADALASAPSVVMPYGDIEVEIGEGNGRKQTNRDHDGTYFKRIADDMLEYIIDDTTRQIAELEAQYRTWERTLKEVRQFLRRNNINALNHMLLSELIYFGHAFPEIQLSQKGSEERENKLWRPRILGIGFRSALECRLERKDDAGVSRYVYLSKKWQSPNDAMVSDRIAALPAIDPMHPTHDLELRLRKFRQDSAPGDNNLRSRPTRWILPLCYPTPGRLYYAQPSWWAVFNDIYQFASNIIRDRAIRKQNENTFGRIIYVHTEYLEKLTLQIDAQAQKEDKERIKLSEIEKIKNFLANKFNNGQTFAAATFIGQDGKDHDAFRVETIPYNTKNAAEADKTEIADASSIIMFALECHPDLIGSTPGGSSSKGGTYQREMLQIKEYKLAPTQQILLSLYKLISNINSWDEHLTWHIAQKTLTTLDRNHSGEEVE